MSDAPAFPSVERTWPRGAFAIALGCGLGSLAGSAALVASTDSLSDAAGLVVVFAVLACLEGAVCVDAVRPWLRGSPVSPRTWFLQLGVALVVLAAFAGGPSVGGAAVCGVLAGILLPTASAIRYSRLNRDLVEDEDRRLAGELAVARPPEEARKTRGGRVPQVGPALREALAEARDRAIAWAAATGVAVVGGLAFDADAAVVLGMVLLGATAVAWVYRRLLRAWFALRDFEGVATEPRHAYVVVLADPRPRMTRPLLGVWSTEPVPVNGRVPLAEAVYRCAGTRSALTSAAGSVVVHEAWLDAGPSTRSARFSVPRWVAADSGLALPQRQVVLGPRYLASVIGSERPARARPLTMPAPNPTAETATAAPVRAMTEPTSGTAQLLRLFSWRLVVLVLAGLVLARLSG
ncbi:MAG: hypothetical protein ABWX73_01440 [Marmoricola sp.]